MKKILQLLLLFILFYQYESYAAVAMFKTDVDVEYGIIKGTITIASSKKEQVVLTPYDDMHILSDDTRVFKTMYEFKEVMESLV